MNWTERIRTLLCDRRRKLIALGMSVTESDPVLSLAYYNYIWHLSAVQEYIHERSRGVRNWQYYGHEVRHSRPFIRALNVHCEHFTFPVTL